jgi:hypothetical protein
MGVGGFSFARSHGILGDGQRPAAVALGLFLRLLDATEEHP